MDQGQRVMAATHHTSKEREVLPLPRTRDKERLSNPYSYAPLPPLCCTLTLPRVCPRGRLQDSNRRPRALRVHHRISDSRRPTIPPFSSPPPLQRRVLAALPSHSAYNHRSKPLLVASSTPQPSFNLGRTVDRLRSSSATAPLIGMTSGTAYPKL